MSQPPILLVPGLNGSPKLLMGVAPSLFPGFRPVPFDHRFDLVDDGVEGIAERALAALDRVGDSGEPAYVCGESFGGAVALTLARRRPERVRGLILLSAFAHYSAPYCYGGRAGLALWRLLGDRVAGGAIHASRPFRAPGALGLRFSRRAFREFMRHERIYPPAYRRKCQAAVTFDARSWLGSIRCPALVVTPTWDPVVPVSAGVELARRIPRARLLRVPGGHAVHLARPGEVGRLIAGWIDGTGPNAERPTE